MELSIAQKDLIRMLKLMGVEDDAVSGILTFLDTADKRDRLMRYLMHNRNASLKDIARKVEELASL